VQLAILKLIASCINKSSPNLAHYLLGFEVATGKPISQTTLQDPGILGSPRTCLHSILSLVEHGQDARNPTGCHYGNTKVAEFCYKVLYLMCASRDLSTPTLRYLRNNHEYFFSQLVHLPLNPDLLPRMSDEDDDEGGDAMVPMTTTFDLKRLSLMHQQAWVLKSVAIELRMTSLSHQRSHTQRIVNLLLSGPSSDITDTSSSDGVGVSMGGAGGGARLKSDFDFLQEGRRKVLVLLDQVDFADKAVLALEQLESPYVAAIEQMVQSCETKVSTFNLRVPCIV
jgi:nuclear pore complex protein Nup205